MSGIAKKSTFILFVLTVLCWPEGFLAQARQNPQTISWNEALKQKPEWYASGEALRIADNVILYQRSSGGWPKNINMASLMSDREQKSVLKNKNDNDSTIDNGATYSQLAFLARVYTAQGKERLTESFLKGLDYLFAAQYPNGGWPQFYPDLNGYYKHITFNDGAMIGVMKLLRDVAAAKSDYEFVDKDRRLKADDAVQRGIECILKTQVIVDGRRTVWCAQHDEVTLAPAPARKYELVSLSGGESVDIVRFLMAMKTPSPAVIESVESAVAWFEKSRLTGIKWIEKSDPAQPGGKDRVVIKDPNAGPLWARFYEIGTNRPIFVGRDGIIKYDVSEIDHERRTSYAWYVEEPAKLLSRDYPGWRKRISPMRPIGPM